MAIASETAFRGRLETVTARPAQRRPDERVPGRVLAIFAHPDDAEFTCGGSIASWADAGATVAYVVCTGGCRGGDELTGTDETVRELRENEQQAAAATLGVSEVTFLRHLDGELDRVQELRYELARIIRRWQPDRVLTWDAWKPYQLHPDHRASGMAAVEAVLAAGNPRASLTPLHEELGPHRASDVYLFGTHDPDVWVDISRTLERKLAAVAAHHSQLSATPDFAQSVRACNRDFGGACGCAYAEAFKALHPFCDT